MTMYIKAKINLKKIQKERLFPGKKGTYMDVIIWVNDEPNQWGQNVSIQQSVNKGEDPIYLGDGKTDDLLKQNKADHDDELIF